MFYKDKGSTHCRVRIQLQTYQQLNNGNEYKVQRNSIYTTTRIHTDTHVYRCDNKHITKTIVFTYYKITIKKGVTTGVNYNQLYTFTVNNIMKSSRDKGLYNVISGSLGI